MDCANVLFGTSVEDACGECGGDNSTCGNAITFFVVPHISPYVLFFFEFGDTGCLVMCTVFLFNNIDQIQKYQMGRFIRIVKSPTCVLSI